MDNTVVADIGGRESKEQLLDTVKSFIHIRGSGLSHTTTQRRREFISPEKPRYFVHTYYTFSLFLIYLPDSGVRLRRRNLSPNSHKSPQNSSNIFTTCIYIQFKSYLQISLWYFTTEWLNQSTPAIHIHRSHFLIHVRSLEHPQHNSPSETRGDLICRACTPVTNHIASPEHVTSQQTTRAHVSP